MTATILEALTNDDGSVIVTASFSDDTNSENYTFTANTADEVNARLSEEAEVYKARFTALAALPDSTVLVGQSVEV